MPRLIRMRRHDKMAAVKTQLKKGCKITENHICSNEVGPRGLTYDETSVVYSLLWNQPSLQPTSASYWKKKSNPLVRRGCHSLYKSHSVGLPLFFTNTLDEEPISEENEGGDEEIHQLSTSTVEFVQPWRKRKRVADNSKTNTLETDESHRVRSELGYPFPPVMSKLVESRLQGKLRERKRRRRKSGEKEEEEEEEEEKEEEMEEEEMEEKVYNQLLVDAQVFLAREIERKLASESHDSHMTNKNKSSSSSSSSPESPNT